MSTDRSMRPPQSFLSANVEVTRLREVTAKQLEWPDPVAACTVREILSHGADGKDLEAAPSPLVERVADYLAEVRFGLSSFDPSDHRTRTMRDE